MKYYIVLIGNRREIDTIKYYKNVYYTLISFFFIRENREAFNEIILASKEVLIDSGAYSIQIGAKEDYDKYVDEYIEFINETKNIKNIVGYFEVDIDSVVGVERVKTYREKLIKTGAKIIPVWHKQRNIDGWLEMCDEYDYIAIPVVKQEDLYFEDMPYFINYATRKGAKVHALGSYSVVKKTGYNIYYSVDSATWEYSIYNNRMFKTEKVKLDKQNYQSLYLISYGIEMLKQIYFMSGDDRGLKYLQDKYKSLVISY